VLQVALATLALGMIALPPVVVGLSDTASADALWTALRLTALEALTFIVGSIFIGAFRPFFVRVGKGRIVQRIHAVAGVAGFCLALAHGFMIIIFGTSGYTVAAVRIGPVVLVVLVLVIITALTRKRFRETWRWVHRLNYLIFAAVLVHGLILGHDLGSGVFLTVCFGLYAAVVAVGLISRSVSLLGQARTGK